MSKRNMPAVGSEKQSVLKTAPDASNVPAIREMLRHALAFRRAHPEHFSDEPMTRERVRAAAKRSEVVNA